MKKADYMIVGIALMLALVSFGVYRLYFASTGRAAIVEITVDGNVYKTLSLKEDATVDVPSDGGHTNTVQIKDGKVFMKKADCPDKICVHHNGETIICLPHKVIVTIQSSETGDLDGVAQ